MPGKWRMKIKIRQLLGLVVTGVLASSVGAASYWVWLSLFQVSQVEAFIDPDCDLRAGACSSQLAGGATVNFSITPRSIPVIEPLQLTVDIEGLKVEAVEVDFNGADMYMGFNRFQLARQDDGIFTGEGRIPVCVREAMEWEARVRITAAQGVYIAPYRFVAVNPDITL